MVVSLIFGLEEKIHIAQKHKTSQLTSKTKHVTKTANEEQWNYKVLPETLSLTFQVDTVRLWHH